jgi:pyruvate, water dikinase
MKFLVNFKDLRLKDIALVGGKNASIGEMIDEMSKIGVRVPLGFATTTDFFRDFIKQNRLDPIIQTTLSKLDPNNLQRLSQAERQLKSAILKARLSEQFIQEVRNAYQQLKTNPHTVFAVRSSATAEDLPEASFAGQHDSFLNLATFEDVLTGIKKVFASLFNQRAIVYRTQNKIPHQKVLISAGIQVMARSDLATSGVMFTLDTESGFDKVVLINASYGLGEAIVKGEVNPDEYLVYKEAVLKKLPAVLARKLGKKSLKIVCQNKKGKLENRVQKVSVAFSERKKYCLTEKELTELALLGIKIEKHYHKPMDIEWAKDGCDGTIYIVQARPETVKSQEDFRAAKYFSLTKKSEILTTGLSIGQKIGQGRAQIIHDPHDMHFMKEGGVLVTDMTDPDWEPIMKRSQAIVTNRGGRTCHAAIVARELGIPAVVGCEDATRKIKTGELVTVSCAEGQQGFVYRGLLPIKVKKVDTTKLPRMPGKIYLNVANPEMAFADQLLPNDGVGLTRIEFIIARWIGIHPKALLEIEKLSSQEREKIKRLTAPFKKPTDFYVDKLREGLAMICAAFFPKPVIIRFSDFKSNEYANLLGGKHFEAREENPLIGFRGASRYLSEFFGKCFAMECEAFLKMRAMGLTNAQVMLPFVRTVEEAKKLIMLLKKFGISRKDGIKIILMCEIPSNVILADQFLDLCDGFSIGSNDLTQLTLGLDRDSSLIAHLFDERNEAVKKLLQQVIKICKKRKKYIGICGEAPSNYPEFAKWLIDLGIDSISLNPDAVLNTRIALAKAIR